MVFFEVLFHNGYRNLINQKRKKESGIWKPTSVCIKEKNIHPTSHKILHRTQHVGKPNCKERLAMRSQCAGHSLTDLIRLSEVDLGIGTPRGLQGASTGEKRGSSPNTNKTTLVESLTTIKIHLPGLLQQ